MMNLTVNDILTPAVLDAGKRVVAAEQKAVKLRAQVDAHKRRLLAANEYLVAREWSNPGPRRRITEPREDFLMSNADFEPYHAKLQELAKLDGHKLPPGHCPALVAERELLEAQRDLVDLVAPLFGLSWDQLVSRGLEPLHKFLDAIMGMIRTRLGAAASWRRAAQQVNSKKFRRA